MIKFSPNLLTEDIENEVRESIKEKSLTPGFVLSEFENEPPVLLRWSDVDNVITNDHHAKRTIRFCGCEVEETHVDEFLSWMSGVITGALTGQE